MKRVIRYSIIAVLLAAGVLVYISYKTSIPVTRLVTEAPELINTLKSASLDAEDIENYTVKEQKILDVLHYDLNLDLYPDRQMIKGDAVIKVVTRGIDKINLNFYDNFDIKKVTLDGAGVKYENKGSRFTIIPTGKLKDTSLVEIVYEGKPESLGFGSFTFGQKNGKSFIYTMSEPVFASTWYPCNDIPSDKALFDIKISNDSSKVSVSNGRLVSVTANGSRKTYHWQTVYPMATYLAAIYSADYKSYSDTYVSASKTKMPIVYYVTPEKLESAKDDFYIHPEAIAVFSKLFGEYPFIKEKYGVAEFLWNNGALENQTITGIGSVFISGMSMQKDLLIHELAHSWWGNAVSLADWKDLWLNEGFATYSTALYYEALTDKRALFSTMSGFKGNFDKCPLYNPDKDLFGKLVYNKGAWVLHMLRKEVGDSTFFKILRKYYSDYKYKNATTADFKNVCESVSKKKLDFFFEQWVFKGKGIIEADFSWSAVKQGENNYLLKIDISQTQDGFPFYRFPLDLKVDAPEGKSEVKTIYINNKNAHFEIKTGIMPQNVTPDPEGWLLAKFNKK